MKVKADKVFKIVMISLILFFLLIFTSEKLGYYENQLGNKAALTNEQIKKFEEDVKNGKEIDVEKYLEVNQKNYNNEVSNLSLKVSSGIEKIFHGGIKFIFRKIEQVIDE